jgi:hypothetical protein
MHWSKNTGLSGIGLEVTPEIPATNAPTRSRRLQPIPPLQMLAKIASLLD